MTGEEIEILTVLKIGAQLGSGFFERRLQTAFLMLAYRYYIDCRNPITITPEGMAALDREMAAFA